MADIRDSSTALALGGRGVRVERPGGLRIRLLTAGGEVSLGLWSLWDGQL